MRRALTASVLAGAIVLGGAAPAMASPGNADGRTKALLQEIEQEAEDARTPDWQKIPDCCVVGESWGYADLILGVSMTVGAVVFFWGG